MRVCFVCLGNICRSPTAEGVFARLVADAGLSDRIVIDSAGTGHWHIGELPDNRSVAAAAQRGITLTHRARQFLPADLDRFDLVVVMDRSNLAAVERMARGHKFAERRTRGSAEGAAKVDDKPIVRLLRSFDPSCDELAEVPDPYAGGMDGFEHVLDLCERACRGLLAHVRERL